MMRHAKLVALAVMLAVFGGVIGLGWAVIGHNVIPTQEQVRDAAMTYIKTNHRETEQFMNNLAWTGGRVDTNLLGAETYTYKSQEWTVTIHYPVIANPAYNITVNYSTTTASGGVSIPYSVAWQGTWENGYVSEASYTFAQ